MDVHDEMRSPLREGGSIPRYTPGRAAHMREKHLAFRSGQTRHAIDRNCNYLIREFSEIVAFPVIARAGRQETVKRRLPGNERSGTDELCNRLAERSKR